jgi:hypothetical protein
MDVVALLIVMADLAAIDLVLRIGRRMRWAALLRHRLAWLRWEGGQTHLIPRSFPR